ncbi:MAG: hypothetical protein U1F27_13475 [Turneriella sp.]
MASLKSRSTELLKNLQNRFSALKIVTVKAARRGAACLSDLHPPAHAGVYCLAEITPSKYIRGAIVAGVLAVISLPVVAVMGGSDSLSLKLPDDKANKAAVIDDRYLSVVQATPEGKISLGDERKEIFVVFSHPVVPLGVLEETTKGAFAVFTESQRPLPLVWQPHLAHSCPTKTGSRVANTRLPSMPTLSQSPGKN